MGSILNRYIFRETAQTWLAVTGVLLVILLVDQFARVLDDAAGAEVPKDAIFAVLGLSTIQYLTILIPVGIFLSIILALARMYRDSEMAALMACGIGNVALYRPIMLLASMLAGVVGWTAMDAGPAAIRAVQEIAEEAKKTADLAMLEPGRFISFGREQAILYAEKISDQGELENVFVQRRRGDRVVVVVAERAGQRNDEQTGKKVLTFTNGERYEGVPGSREFRVMKFAEHGIPFQVRESAPEDLREEAKTLSELLEAGDLPAIAELQWRLSVPISLLVLALIAVPLSRAPPRQGRYNNLAIGILLYVMYSNMLVLSKAWVEDGALSPWVGMWWVHADLYAVRGNFAGSPKRWYSSGGGQEKGRARGVRIFNRYLFNAIASSTGLVILVLLSIGAFVEFVQQLDHLGQGDYDVMKAILFVALKMPRLVGGALPILVLLGALLGLGALANHGELIVMRAAGVSIGRIATSVGMAGLTIAILGGLVNEFVAPKMDLYARQMRAVAKSGEADMTGSSAWLRDGDTIFNLRPSISGTDYGGVYVFRMGKRASLTGIGRADSVQTDDGDAWSLSNYKESMLSDTGVAIGTQVNAEQARKLSDLLAITAVRESSLTGAELWAYVKYLKSNDLESDRYEIAFWNRIATVAGIAVMCMLALPFVLGPLRSKGAGTRMLIGTFIGVGYFLLTRTLTDSAAIFDLSPILVAWLPTAILAVVVMVAMRRVQ